MEDTKHSRNFSAIKRLCVYCGSSVGSNPIYTQAAQLLAQQFIKNDIELVYGGGKVGLMGVIADEVMRLGGRVSGVIPQALLDLEVGHHGLSQLHVVKTMHERKAMMADLSDGFIAMPGGIGTLEELFEILTWAQLGIHNKPIGLLNIDGFFDSLIKFLDQLVEAKFVNPSHAKLLLHAKDAPSLLKHLMADAANRSSHRTSPVKI